jgi:hypothetical protein
MFLRLALVSLLFAFQAQAHEKLSIQSMTELDAIEKQAPARATLFVFDIDNTLLTTKIDLGGDAWFGWQENLLKTNPQSPDLVAPDFAGLINVQGWMYTLGQMIPPEAATPQIFRALQDAGHPVILLTSRSLDFENLTMKELARNGYEPQRAAIAPRAGFAAAFLPYDLQNPEAACLTREDIAKLGLGEAHPVVYRAGVMLTSGQNKGAMLRTLLCKLGKTYDRIVFVDDQQKHVDRVFAAYENQPGDVRSIRYTQMDAQVERFVASDKSEVRDQWSRLKEVIESIFK